MFLINQILPSQSIFSFFIASALLALALALVPITLTVLLSGKHSLCRMCGLLCDDSRKSNERGCMHHGLELRQKKRAIHIETGHGNTVVDVEDALELGLLEAGDGSPSLELRRDGEVETRAVACLSDRL